MTTQDHVRDVLNLDAPQNTPELIAKPTLMHFWLSGDARAARLILFEKDIDFQTHMEKPWERSDTLTTLSPGADLPVFIATDKTPIVGLWSLVEHLDEAYPEPSILGSTPQERAETRRLNEWFMQRFAREVLRLVVEEKIIRRLSRQGAPRSDHIRAGLQNLNYHMAYICHLIDGRSWLAGEHFSTADLIAAAHLSCLDYMGDVPWERYPEAKEWYSWIKSKPCFKPLLNDRIPGIAPAEHYADLDF